MISIILYGRNDSYGYNYHKRAAMSINCLAQLLTADNDEIIYVDYNTPNDLPTFPQAIEDILTLEARKKIRILRVRPEQHKLLAKNTPLEMLEPHARNIAIRRSNPANRWILSTNTDMIFVPHQSQQSLTNIVANLSDQCYELPRFELPEYWWEFALSRLDPRATIQHIRNDAKKLHLPMTVSHSNYILYDNPGDFQLIPRKTLFEIHGFNEAMSLGWHNDSNLCKRLFLYFNHKIESLADQLSGYHCNHTRRATYMHSKNRTENSWHTFVRNVNTPYLPEQADRWGCPNIDIEEIRLSETLTDKLYLQALEQTLANCEPTHYQVNMNRERYNYAYYPSAHLFPYLADHLISLAPNASIAYLGYNQILLALLTQFWQRMGYTGTIYSYSSIQDADVDTLKNNCVLFIFDFGFDDADSRDTSQTHEQRWLTLCNLRKYFVRLVRVMKKHRLNNRKFIGINAIYSDFKGLFDRYLVSMDASYNSNLVYGYLKSKPHRRFHFNRKALPYQLRRYIKSTVYFYLCYWFPLFSLRLIQWIKRTNISKHLFLAD